MAQYAALYKADVAAYRQTVLTAFQQVEDYIATLRILSQQIAQQEAAVRAAQRYLDIALAQYQTGLDPYLDVLTAQTLLLGDQQTLVTLRVSEMTAAVQLDPGARRRMGRVAVASRVADHDGEGRTAGLRHTVGPRAVMPTRPCTPPTSATDGRRALRKGGTRLHSRACRWQNA